MKRKFLPAVSLIIIMALAACGPKPTPGLNVTDVQNTAVALALTGISITQSAMPTNSPVPPTPTAQVATLAFPTLAAGTPAALPAAPVNSADASPTPDCYQPAPAPKKLLGATVNVKLVNKSDGPVNLSMGMYEPNDEGECYTFGFGVSKNGSEVVTILSGCYWASGYQNGPKPSTPRVDYICLNDTDQTRGLTITNNTIGFD